MPIRRVTTEPPWTTREAADGELIVRGRTRKQPWGFGQHPATSLCLSLLTGIYSETGPRPARMVELNCGTGLLCIAAQKLGAESALGLEADAELRAIAEENAQANGSSARFVAPPEAGSEPYDLAVANLDFAELQDRSRTMAALAPRGHLLLAGFVEAERESLEQQFVALGFRLLYREAREGFLATVFKSLLAGAPRAIV